MFIWVSLSLDHWPIISVSQESDACGVEGLGVVLVVIYTCHTLFMHHITQQCLWSSMFIFVSLSLDHYLITDGHKSTYFGL